MATPEWVGQIREAFPALQTPISWTGWGVRGCPAR